jgi:hypothetical protein
MSYSGLAPKPVDQLASDVKRAAKQATKGATKISAKAASNGPGLGLAAKAKGKPALAKTWFAHAVRQGSGANAPAPRFVALKLMLPSTRARGSRAPSVKAAEVNNSQDQPAQDMAVEALAPSGVGGASETGTAAVLSAASGAAPPAAATPLVAPTSPPTLSPPPPPSPAAASSPPHGQTSAPSQVPAGEVDNAPNSGQQDPAADAGQEQRTARRVKDPSVVLTPAVPIAYKQTAFSLRAVRKTEADLVALVGKDIYLLTFRLNLAGCFETETIGSDHAYLKYICQNLSDETPRTCSCGNHTDSGNGPCPGFGALMAYLAQHGREAASYMEAHRTDAIVQHADLCWSVATEDEPTVLVRQHPRNRLLSCTGSRAACHAAQPCNHRRMVAMHFLPDAEEADDGDEASGKSSQLPVVYNAERHDFEGAAVDSHVSCRRKPDLLLKSEDGTEFTYGGSVEAFTKWTLCNINNEVPLVNDPAVPPCCPGARQDQCRCYVASTTGFAVIDIMLCGSCRRPVSLIDDEYDLWLGSLDHQAKKTGPKDGLWCFGLCVSTVRLFFLRLNTGINLKHLCDDMRKHLASWQAGRPPEHIFRLFPFNYNLLRHTLYTCLAQCGIMDLLRKTSCLPHHGHRVTEVTMDGIFVGIKNVKLVGRE